MTIGDDEILHEDKILCLFELIHEFFELVFTEREIFQSSVPVYGIMALFLYISEKSGLHLR